MPRTLALPEFAPRGMASDESPPKAKGPPSLDDLFKGKAKKKAKPLNLNKSQAVEKPPDPPPRPARPAEPAELQWERALRRDEDTLKACGLWMKAVEADGACLFRAFADQMEGDSGEKHASYRETCVDFLEAHRADFEPFLEEDFDGYCQRMREPAVWGGHVEAQALAQALGMNVVIHRPADAEKPEDLDRASVEILVSDLGDARCIQLSFHPTHHVGQHYNSVRCSDDDGAGPAPAMSMVELRRRMEDARRPPEPEAKASAGGPKAKPRCRPGKVF